MGVFGYNRSWKSVTGAIGAVGSFVFDGSGLRGMSCAWIVATNKRNPKTWMNFMLRRPFPLLEIE
jgi:hypothetical protein